MAAINPQARELNTAIEQSNSAVYQLLSEKGKAQFFPKSGIIKQAAQAKGKKINATIGMAIEDDGSPMRLGTIAKHVDLDPGKVFPYASSYGSMDLRQAWKALIREKNPSLKAETSLPVVTNALTHALSVAGMLFVDPGDAVIVTDKFWGNYRLIFEHWHRGKITPFNTYTQGGFDLKALEKTLEEVPGKQVLVLNFPNNPSGYTPTQTEADDIAAILLKSAEKGNRLAVMTDDAYFGLVYEDGIYRESIFAKLADLHENILAVKIDGATKEDYVWGFRVGFITYASKGMTAEVFAALEDKTGGAIRGNISNASNLSQNLVFEAMADPDYAKQKAEKYNLLKSRYNTVKKVFKNHPEYAEYFEPLPYNSGYFMCVELKNGLPGETVRKILLDQYSTGVISIGNLIRVAFSSVSASNIPILFENLKNACASA